MSNMNLPRRKSSVLSLSYPIDKEKILLSLLHISGVLLNFLSDFHELKKVSSFNLDSIHIF